jgi:hypothetical protein
MTYTKMQIDSYVALVVLSHICVDSNINRNKKKNNIDERERERDKVMAKIALFVGSVRRDRQGIKVARWIEERLKNRNHIVFFIDPLELNLPLLDRMYKEMVNPSEKLRDLRNKVKDAEGYLSVTPEYNHSTSATMKNTLDYF